MRLFIIDDKPYWKSEGERSVIIFYFFPNQAGGIQWKVWFRVVDRQAAHEYRLVKMGQCEGKAAEITGAHAPPVRAERYHMTKS